MTTTKSRAVSAQYPWTCPVCKAKSSEPCRTLKSGRVTDTHLARLTAGPRLEVKTKMVPQYYITLHWKKIATGYDVAAGRAEKGEVLDSGVVDIPMSLVYELAEQGTWDSQFGSAFVGLDTKQGWAMVQAGLAVQETRGGHHRTELLLEWLRSEGLA